MRNRGKNKREDRKRSQRTLDSQDKDSTDLFKLASVYSASEEKKVLEGRMFIHERNISGRERERGKQNLMMQKSHRMVK